MLCLLLFVELVGVGIDIINCYYYIMMFDIIIWEFSSFLLFYWENLYFRTSVLVLSSIAAS